MTKLTFLGTASAIPDRDHHNTHLLIETHNRVLLIDCGENPIPRLDQIGVDPLSITDLILTHFHPDHVSGVPLFLMDLWLMGKNNALTIHALEEVNNRVKKILALFDWEDWAGIYPVKFNNVNSDEGFIFFSDEDLCVISSPACHLIPNISVRIDFPEGSICYSSDTSPCESLIKLAKDVDILIHEAGGGMYGHSSAEQAGQIAQQAAAKALYLVHYPPNSCSDDLINEARMHFLGEISIAEDFMVVNLI